MDLIVWLLSGVCVLPLLHAPPLRMRRRGTEHLPRTGPVLVVCNHVSVADPTVLMAAARPRRTAMMAKSQLFRLRPLGWYLRRVRAFPVRRGTADFVAIRHVGMLALRTGATVVPAVVWDTQLFRGPARVVFGPPIDVSDVPPGPRKARNRAATDRIMAFLAGMVAEAGGPAQDPPLGAPPPVVLGASVS